MTIKSKNKFTHSDTVKDQKRNAKGAKKARSAQREYKDKNSRTAKDQKILSADKRRLKNKTTVGCRACPSLGNLIENIEKVK